MVTIDIEDNGIHVVQVKGRRVEKYGDARLEPGLVQDGVVLDTATVAERLKELLRTRGISERKVIAGVSGIHSIYRLVRTPVLPKSMMGEAVKREMGRVMPVSLSEIYSSWQAEPVSNVENVICMVGLPRNTVDAMMQTLALAGFEVTMIDVNPLALARVSDEKNALVINVQSGSFDIVVMINGIPELMRSLPFPSKEMDEGEKIELIKGEIGRTISFYNSGHKADPISENTAAFIFGDHREELARQLSFAVKPMVQMLSYPDEFTPEDYIVNLGLALKETKANSSQIRININSMPAAFVPQPRSVAQIVALACILLGILVLGYMAYITGHSLQATKSLQLQVDTARATVDARKGTAGEIDQLESNLEGVTADLAYYKEPLINCAVAREEINGDLSRVTSLLPGAIDLERIDYGKSGEDEDLPATEWNVSGIAADELVVVNYCNYLRQTERYDKVMISQMERVEFNEVAFVITLINNLDQELVTEN